MVFIFKVCFRVHTNIIRFKALLLANSRCFLLKEHSELIPTSWLEKASVFCSCMEIYFQIPFHTSYSCMRIEIIDTPATMMTLTKLYNDLTLLELHRVALSLSLSYFF